MEYTLPFHCKLHFYLDGGRIIYTNVLSVAHKMRFAIVVGIFGFAPKSCEANAVIVDQAVSPLIETWKIKKALGGALAVERLFSIRDQLGRAASKDAFARDGFLAQGEQDVETLVKSILDMHARGEMSGDESILLNRKIGGMRRSNNDWESLALFDDDHGELYHGMGKRFTAFMKYITTRLGREAAVVSTNPLEEKKIYEYLEKSVYNDMFDMIRRSDGKHALDGKRLTLRARAATSLLAKTTFELLSSKSTSAESKILIVNSLLSLVSANGLNERLFEIEARKKMGESLERLRDEGISYKKQKIVGYSKVIEALLEESSSDARKNLEIMRLEYLEKPREMI